MHLIINKSHAHLTRKNKFYSSFPNGKLGGNYRLLIVYYSFNNEDNLFLSISYGFAHNIFKSNFDVTIGY